MKRILYGMAILSMASGCADLGEGESTDGQEAALDVQGAFNLTRKVGTLHDTNEAARQVDTGQYYDTVRVTPNGVSGGTINSQLPTLASFISNYGFAGHEVTASYYNRGDLGIGREMHCVDNLTVQNNGQIACYVTNFAAGDDKSEFTFGFSSSIAFSNIALGHSFATVGMVYRDLAPAPNKVFFVVYGADGALLRAAALDRVGVLFANAFDGVSNPDPAVFGTPGQNFNNHIPSNCVSCHGGQPYDAVNHLQTGSLFLPFDLDRLESPPGVDQTLAFKHLNEMVWRVAARSGSDVSNTLPDPVDDKSPDRTTSQPVRTQLNAWYGNTILQTDPRSEVFENDFRSGAGPSNWSGIYASVIGPSCRGCHMSNMIHPFEQEADFLKLGGLPASDICSHQMPHSLQTMRLFWQSAQPAALASYLGVKDLNDLAHNPNGCGPGNVVTLDPHEIVGAL